MTIDLLSRLHPEDVHPARLAGPHAWARWGLGPPPPVDASLRFAVPHGTNAESVDRIVEAIQARLVRASWPPQPSLRVARTGSRLDAVTGGVQATVSVEPERATASAAGRPAGTVADARGWFILDETAALADRLMAGQGEDEEHALIQDLARWGALKGDQVVHRRSTTSGIPIVLADLRRICPEAGERLGSVLRGLRQHTGARLSPELTDGLRYLRDEALSDGRARRPPSVVAVR